MSLITCAKCNFEHSENAALCPQCGHNRNVKYKPCRVCGEMLLDGYHRVLRSETTLSVSVNGTGGNDTNYWFGHRPCTKCGEPMPHKASMDDPFLRVLTKGALLAGSLLGAYLFFNHLGWLEGWGYLWLYFGGFGAYFAARQYVVGY